MVLLSSGHARDRVGYLEGQGDLVSRSIRGITRVTTFTYLLRPAAPPSNSLETKTPHP